MKNTSGISWSRYRKPISLAWAFNEDGSPLYLAISPHNQANPGRMVFFEYGRRAYELLNPGAKDALIRRYQ